MPIQHTWEKQGVYRKVTGSITGAEYISAVEEVSSAPSFETIRYVINDLLEVTEQNLTTDDIEYMAAIDSAASKTNPNIVIAIIATEKQIQALAKLYGDISKRLVSPYRTEIFTNTEDARAWVKNNRRLGEYSVKQIKL